MKFTSPGGQRVVEAVKARESKRLFHFRNKKTVADQIQKFAHAGGRLRSRHGGAQGDGFGIIGHRRIKLF
jgi:hypothetical protein